ncbi:hypothetical protein HPC49_35765 [Pyxidicoccus fallax]|uniref:DUF4168 domain-containing protein n=1 Tax=Pyxidicoccus fallax TaxID=394095 RepID=A0A848LTQ6_9BACT|nr:hypothetical protein [Pyxidicoccus fallax]NMO21335.1 hypothetical protein [Pyxidicoccus fallax]NPC83568.1 hypothetical protein [Pyxidicoccus fallax]
MAWKTMTWVMVLAFPVLACAQDVGARQGSGGDEPGPRRPPSSLELLLEYRETLALTPEQVGRVAELQSALEEQNAPLHEQLRTQRPPRPPPGDASRAGGAPPRGEPPDAARMQQAEPLFQELRANDEAAYAQAEQVLTDTQKTRARELITQAREEQRQRHEAMRERMGSRQ